MTTVDKFKKAFETNEEVKEYAACVVAYSYTDFNDLQGTEYHRHVVSFGYDDGEPMTTEIEVYLPDGTKAAEVATEIADALNMEPVIDVWR